MPPLPPFLFRRLHYLVLISAVLLLSACGSASAGESPATHRTASPTPAPTVRSLAPPEAGSYAALGASETYGVGAEPHTRGYAWLVSHVLHARRFVNLGIPGTTLNAAYDGELTSALSIRPSLCTVFFGVNDLRAGVTRASFLLDLHDLAATLRRAHARVLIIGMPDLSHIPAVERSGIGGLHEISTSWNSGMRAVARQTGSQFLDLSEYDREIASHPRYISGDGLHPSNAGYARLAQVVAQTVVRRGLWRQA